jgi:hypothetical protein
VYGVQVYKIGEKTYGPSDRLNRATFIGAGHRRIARKCVAGSICSYGSLVQREHVCPKLARPKF